MDRIAILRSMFDARGVGLEIGAGFSPILRKADGYAVETLDHASAAELREKWKDDPLVDVSRIEEVDHVSHGGSIAEALPLRQHYDFILASHVIEHTPDMLGFLKDCQALLKPGGVLVLAVPDKRRCFDVFGPLSSTGAVLQAHLEKRQRHLPGTVFDYHACYARRAGAIGWGAGSDAPLAFGASLGVAQAAFDAAVTSTDYQDVHAWRFTPSSFRLILRDLNDLDALQLCESQFIEAPGVEFYVALSVHGTGCTLDRLSLCKLLLVEQYEVLAGPGVPAPAAAAATAPAAPASAATAIEERLARVEALLATATAR